MGEVDSGVQAVLPIAALTEGAVTACQLAGQDVLVCLVEGQAYALHGQCPHAGSSLRSARLNGFELVCPRHGARFDVRTGGCTNRTTEKRIATYPVFLERGKVHV